MKRKAILITGALRRLGRELALESARAGYDVIAHSRVRETGAVLLRKELEALSASVHFVQQDFSKGAGDFLRRCFALRVPLYGLVNSASIFERGNFKNCRETGLQRFFNINAFVPLALTQEFAGAVRHGVVINLLDANIDGFNANFQAYRASKRLLRDFTRECALLFAPRVRVNAIAPGALLPSRQGQQRFETIRQRTPLSTGGSLDDFRAAFRYLLQAKSVTGQVLYADGGMHLKS